MSVSAAILTVCISDVLNKVGICGRSVHNVMAYLTYSDSLRQ